MNLIIVPHRAVGLPDGAEAGGFRGHHVDAAAKVHAELLDAGAGELEYLILNKAARKGLGHKGERHIVRADALFWLARYIA